MVYYNGATHGSWCGAKTRPNWNCKYCGSRVFYFTCNCGCKVLFENLGHPWNEHNCPERQKVFDAEIKNVVKKWVRKIGIERTAKYLDMEISEVKDALD